MNDVYPFTVGAFECLAIDDGGFAISAEMLFANAPDDLLAEALDAHDERAEEITSTWTCLLVNTGAELVLIDTGGGQGGERGGRLLPALIASGVEPEDVDTVILTHSHSDHIAGAIREDGSPTFPNATYVMGETEWDYWTRQDTLAEAPSWAAKVARKVLPALKDRMRTVAVPGEVVPGIRLIPAFGHTPGHAAVEITSDGEQLIYFADTALHPIHLEYPHWVAVLDQNAEQSVQTRKSAFQRAAERKQLVLLFHFTPFPSLGYIVAAGDAWRWQRAAP